MCVIVVVFGRSLVQDKSWSKKYDLLVATPLRLLSVVRAQAIDLSAVQTVVLDEADKLFDLEAGKGHKAHEEGEEEDDISQQKESGKKRKAGKGKEESGSDDEDNDGEGEEESDGAAPAERIRTSFLSQVDEILAECPDKGVQRALFSATVGSFVRELAESFLQNPVQITIGKENAGATTIDQKLVFVGREDGKLLAIRQIVQAGLRPPVLLFMQSIDRAKVRTSTKFPIIVEICAFRSRSLVPD
jgi:ATP-dependent RNA helicase DDX52/ROK1